MQRIVIHIKADRFLKYGHLHLEYAAKLSVASTTIVTGCYYNQTSNLRRTLVGNNNFYHPDVVDASPVGTVPNTF